MHSTYPVPPLDPGEWYEVDRQEVIYVAQIVSIRAVADVNDNVVESDATNNERTETCTVGEGHAIYLPLIVNAPQGPS